MMTLSDQYKTQCQEKIFFYEQSCKKREQQMSLHMRWKSHIEAKIIQKQNHTKASENVIQKKAYPSNINKDVTNGDVIE